MFIALVTWRVKRMRCFALSSVACLAPLYFATLFHNRHDKRKAIEHKMCVLMSYAAFMSRISHSKKNSARYYQNVKTFSGKLLVILVRD